MAQDKIQMPSSQGGLIRYFDDYQSKIEIKPGHIIVLIITVVVIEILLNLYGSRLLGLG